MNHQDQVVRNINELASDEKLRSDSFAWINDTARKNYSYNFSWLSRPIIQYPQDIVAMQELIWLVKPDLIIETGIAHGGSLIFSASMLALLDKYLSIYSSILVLNSVKFIMQIAILLTKIKLVF